jgi:DNA-binding NarL/FixJ family response regulator
MTEAPRDTKTRLGLVVEDQGDARAWLVDILGQTFNDMQVEEFADLTTAQAWLKSRESADDGLVLTIALIDLGLPDGSGIDIIRALHHDHPHSLPVVTTIYSDDTHLFDAIAAGAKGYLLKDQDSEALAHHLKRIDRGEPPISPSIARRMLDYFRVNPPTSEDQISEVALTPRETEVLRLIGRGLRVAEASNVLGISSHTVADYVKSIYAKLNISSRAEAGLEAARRGLT